VSHDSTLHVRVKLLVD